MIETAEAGRLIEALPYRLTGAQLRVWREIEDDLVSGNRMNRLVQVTDEDGQVQHTFRYSASGRLEEESDGAGYATLYTYDLTGNRTGMWEPVEMSDGGEVLYRVTLYEYDSESNKIREKRGLDKVRAGQIPVRTHELRFTYDARNRLTMVEDPSGARAEYRYNSLNQKTYESFRISEHVERVIRYEYDAVGNLIRRSEGIEERFRKPAAAPAWSGPSPGMSMILPATVYT